MTDHDISLLATKYGSWFGNTLELRKEGLVALVKAVEQAALQNAKVRIPPSVMEQEFQRHYKRGFEAGVAASEADWKDK